MDFSSTDEVLDILFDADDPLIKEMDQLMNCDDVKNLGGLQLNDLTVDDNFWMKFLKDTEACNQVVTNKDYPPSSRTVLRKDSETDSGLQFGESSSPRSSCSSENNSSPSASRCESASDANDCDMEGFGIQNNSRTIVPSFNASLDSSSFPIPDATISTFDIGADVVVVTSEISINEDMEAIEDMNVSFKVSDQVEDLEDNTLCELTIENDSTDLFSKGTPLIKLSEEEKILMKKEGLHIPLHMPLTKSEERELKRIRRKIRNKQSAQDSRKRKKAYVDGLESRVKLCTSQNIQLQKKVQMLEKQNVTLLEQLKQLKAMITNHSSKPVQSTTCLMVLLLSFVFLIIPNLVPSIFESKELLSSESEKLPPVAGRSRSLLYTPDVWDKGRADHSYTDNMSESYVPAPKAFEWEASDMSSVQVPTFEKVTDLDLDLKPPIYKNSFEIPLHASSQNVVKKCEENQLSECDKNLVLKMY